MVKIILLSLTYFTIKLISFFYLCILILINEESKKILNKKENICIRPKIISETSDKMPIGTILYNIYWNKVFNLTYMKIMIGQDKFWFKIIRSINFIKLFKSLILILFGISKFMIQLWYNIFNYKEESIELYLTKKFLNPIDDRLIIRINNEWKINGKNEKILEKWKNYLWSTRNYSHEHIESAQTILYLNLLKWEKLTKECIWFNKIQKGMFKDIKKIPHIYYPGLTKEGKIAYSTDYNKAKKFNNYNKETVIEKFDGEKKESILLQDDISNFIAKGVVKEEPGNKLIMGAIINGYNPDLINYNLNKKIKEFEDVYEDIKKLMISIGIDEKHADIIAKEYIEEYKLEIEID